MPRVRPTFSITIAPGLDEALRVAAYREYTTRSSIVERALAAWFAQRGELAGQCEEHAGRLPV